MDTLSASHSTISVMRCSISVIESPTTANDEEEEEMEKKKQEKQERRKGGRRKKKKEEKEEEEKDDEIYSVRQLVTYNFVTPSFRKFS